MIMARKARLCNYARPLRASANTESPDPPETGSEVDEQSAPI
jgi:hypothetical protein